MVVFDAFNGGGLVLRICIARSRFLTNVNTRSRR